MNITDEKISDMLNRSYLDLVNLLKELNLTISCAESCTGGLISKLLTDVSGSSKIFMGSVVAYNNKIKENVLNVKKRTLEDFGAVSLETAIEMCRGVNASFDTSISVSTTGIAGPSGGTDNKPVGMVCFGFVIKGSEFTKIKQFSGDRDDIRNSSALFVSDFILEKLFS